MPIGQWSLGMLGDYERVSMASSSGKIVPVCVDARLVCISICGSTVARYFFFKSGGPHMTMRGPRLMATLWVCGCECG